MGGWFSHLLGSLLHSVGWVWSVKLINGSGQITGDDEPRGRSEEGKVSGTREEKERVDVKWSRSIN